MSKIQKIGRPQCDVLRRALEEAVANSVELQALGVEFKTLNGTFAPSKFGMKVEFLVGGVDQAKIDFDRDCYLFDLKPEHYGEKVAWAGKHYKIVGVKPRSPKFPVIGELPNGKRFKLPERAVRDLALPIAAESAAATVVDFKPRPKGSKGGVGK